jgi:hypothetical protein
VVETAVPDQPLDLRAGEVGVEHQAGAVADELLPTLLLELGAALGGAAVLPDDRGCQRLTRRAVPGDDGLALVGDADGLRLAAACVVDRLLGDRDRHVPGLRRVVLHPARLREVLLELAVGAAGDLAVF